MCDTVLQKYWYYAVSLAWFHFLVVQSGMEYDHLKSFIPLCPHEDRFFPSWYWDVYHSVFGGYIFVLALLVIKILMTNAGPDRISYFPTIHLVTISAISVGFAFMRNWGGICIDIFGVASPGAIWAEWMACSPLLLFITISASDKKDFSIEDIMLLLTFWLPFVLGYIFHMQQPYWLACVWLILAFVVLILNFCLLFRASTVNLVVSDTMQASDFQRLSGNLAKKTNLIIVHACIIPLFPLWYMIVVFGMFDKAATIAVFQVLTFFSKAIFAVVATDTHVQLLSPAMRALIEERRANEARRAFLRYIFHEVRTPLNSLTMGIEIFERSDHLDDSELDALIMMKDASSFMAETLNDVLSMQKIEEGKLELELNPFSLQLTISKVFSTFKGVLRSKNMEAVLVMQSNFPESIIGDRFRVEHVISNLLSNAIKFSPANVKIKIVVSFKTQDTVDTTRVFVDVTVSCIDEGPGISKTDQDKLFTNFMQIQPGTLQNGQGTGIGLSLCKQIVTLHGGVIACRSSRGHGSEFYFTIPFEVCFEREDAVDDEAFIILPYNGLRNSETSTRLTAASFLSARESSFVAKSIGEGIEDNIYRSSIDLTIATQHSKLSFTRAYKALVVDDTDSNRKMLTMLLQREGVTVTSAGDGDEAVEIIASNLDDYRLILMDNFMIRMNGIEATREIRAGGYKYIIAGVTGDVLEEDMNMFSKAGADIILPKPLKMTSLVMLLWHIDTHGGESQQGMKLVQSAGALVWVSEK